MSKNRLYEHAIGWLQELEDIASNVDENSPESQMTQFEKNLLKDLRDLLDKEDKR